MYRSCDDCKNIVIEDGKKYCSVSWSYEIAKELAEIRNINDAGGCSRYTLKGN